MNYCRLEGFKSYFGAAHLGQEMIKSRGRRPDGIHISLNVPSIARVFDITGGVGPPLCSARSRVTVKYGQRPGAWVGVLARHGPRAWDFPAILNVFAEGSRSEGSMTSTDQAKYQRKRTKKFNPCGRNHFIYFPLSLISVKSSQAFFLFNRQQSKKSDYLLNSMWWCINALHPGLNLIQNCLYNRGEKTEICIEYVKLSSISKRHSNSVTINTHFNRC